MQKWLPGIRKPVPGSMEVAERPERRVIGISNDDVIEDFDLEQLPRPDEVARDLDVGI